MRDFLSQKEAAFDKLHSTSVILRFLVLLLIPSFSLILLVFNPRLALLIAVIHALLGITLVIFHPFLYRFLHMLAGNLLDVLMEVIVELLSPILQPFYYLLRVRQRGHLELICDKLSAQRTEILAFDLQCS